MFDRKKLMNTTTHHLPEEIFKQKFTDSMASTNSIIANTANIVKSLRGQIYKAHKQDILIKKIDLGYIAFCNVMAQANQKYVNSDTIITKFMGLKINENLTLPNNAWAIMDNNNNVVACGVLKDES